MRRISSLAALLPLASCQTEAPPDLHISGAWARETLAASGATAAYLTIANGGGSDRLVAVTAPPPVQASLHRTRRSDGISRMEPLPDGLEVPAGATVRLEPGGAHVMLMKVPGPLRPGGRLQLALRFQRSGERTISVEVVKGSAVGTHSGTH